ncbi:MAG: hypothetical protein WAO41_00720 [Candidatus Nanopelagicales bacterium]
MSPRFSARLGKGQPKAPALSSPTISSPRANRPQRQWWRDSRVLLGAALVVGCMLVGARLMTLGADDVLVWQVNRDLGVGSVVTPTDLQPVAVNRQLADNYVSVADRPTGPLGIDVRAGDLLGSSAFVTQMSGDTRRVTVPVEPLHAPVDLAIGDRVDVWSTPDVDLGERVEPELVLAGLLVTAVDSDARGFATDYGVIVDIDANDAGLLLRAIRVGRIDLVGVPFAGPPDFAAAIPVTQVGQR